MKVRPILASLALGVATAVPLSAPADAATRVTVVNFTDRSIHVNGHKVKPGHHISNVKRKTMKISSPILARMHGMNWDGSRPARQICMRPDVTYKGGALKSNKKLSDGDLDQFGVWKRCTGNDASRADS